LFAALSVNTRAREVMLPILLFPIMVPVLIAGVRAMGALLDGETLQEITQWLRLLVAYDAIFIAAAFLLFDYVVEE
jgi:heme exporter protein B